MCSVVGCFSKRRTHKPELFKLPEDPERRLQWVLFLATANEQRFKESSWEEITICSDHFKYDSFETMPPAGKLTLKPGAVPSLCPHSGTNRLEAHLKSLMCAVPQVVTVNNAQASSDEDDVSSAEDSDDDTTSEEEDLPPDPTDSELCTECGMFFNKNKRHTCEHIIKPFSCNICGERCVSEGALNVHSRVHDGNHEYQCKYCHVKFRTKADKISHEQIHSTEEKPYKCPDCSETFATKRNLNIHLDVHRGPRKSKCHICGIQFTRSLYLRRHLLVHTGEKPFKCSVCGRGFKQASHLKSHVRLHTGERPYKCQQCDKCFNHNVSLKSHVQRYHAGKQTKEERNERESDGADIERNSNKRGAESDLTQDKPKYKRQSTGRPIGRPKRKESDNIVVTLQVEGQCSNSKAGKQQVQRLKRTRCIDGGSNDEARCSDRSFGSSEEEEERSEKETKSRQRPKDRDSDSDFDPEERKKKSGKSSGKRRGRPRKNLAV